MRQNRTWTDPAAARREDPDFMLQGEYTGRRVGLQLVALGGGKFDGYLLDGGLPGAGWEPGRSRTLLKSDEALERIKSLKRVERKSPTLGKKAPRRAVVLFDGRSADAWERGKVEGGFFRHRMRLQSSASAATRSTWNSERLICHRREGRGAATAGCTTAAAGRRRCSTRLDWMAVTTSAAAFIRLPSHG